MAVGNKSFTELTTANLDHAADHLSYLVEKETLSFEEEMTEL
jgi:hypothetical protein